MLISRKRGNVPDMLLRWRVERGDTKRRGGRQNNGVGPVAEGSEEYGKEEGEIWHPAELPCFFHFASELPQEG